MKRTIIAAAFATAAMVGTGAQAATVFTFTGVRAIDDQPFEAIFRFDTPSPSFTFTMDGKILGFDQSHIPFEMERSDSNQIVYFSLRAHVGLDGGQGKIYLAGRFSDNPRITSSLGMSGDPWWSPLYGRFEDVDLVISSQPDLPVGYKDLSGLIPGHSIPEPSTWALMISGFGIAGAGLRKTRRRIA